MNLIVRDGLFGQDLLDQANECWPYRYWPGWVSYEEKHHCKMASDLTFPLPSIFGLLLSKMALLPLCDWFDIDLVPDLSLHGGGIHQMSQGGVVGSHLDADTHPRLGVERVISSVLYVHPKWEMEYGGELILDATCVQPLPGRLVVFDCRDQRHHVMPVKSVEERRSLTLFWYAPRLGTNTRRRAQFQGG